MKKFKTIICSIIDKNNLKKIFPVILLLLLTTLVIGITYAIYNASFTGNYNSITNGLVSMSYTESTNVIAIENALPVSDKEGKESSNYFDFSVTTNLSLGQNDPNTTLTYLIEIEPLVQAYEDYSYNENATEEQINQCTTLLLDYIGMTEDDENYANYYSLYNIICSGETYQGVSLQGLVDSANNGDDTYLEIINAIEPSGVITINNKWVLNNNPTEEEINSCVATLVELGADNSLAQAICSGGEIEEGITLQTMVDSTNNGEDDYLATLYILEPFGIVSKNHEWTVKKNPTESEINSCTLWFVEGLGGLTEDDESYEEAYTVYSKLCTGKNTEAFDGLTLQYLVDYELSEMGEQYFTSFAKTGIIEGQKTEDGFYALRDNQIKVYLEDLTNNRVLVDSKLVSNLNNHILYGVNHIHEYGTDSITTNYRLRAWIDYDTDASSWSEDNRYEYKFRVNINGDVKKESLVCYTTEQITDDDDNVIGVAITGYNEACGTNVEIPETYSYVPVVGYSLVENPTQEAINNCVLTFLELDDEMITYAKALCSGKEIDGVSLESTFDSMDLYEAAYNIGTILKDTGMVEPLYGAKVVEYPTNEAINSCTNAFLDIEGVTEENSLYKELYSAFHSICSGGTYEGISLSMMLSDSKYGAEYIILLADTGILEFGQASTTETQTYPVLEIRDSAFESSNLTSVKIPSTVTTIGSKAFYDNNLTTISLSDNVTSIGDGAFTKNNLPESIAYIYARSDSDSDGVAEINNTKLVSYGGSSTDFNVPDTVTTIGSYAFDYLSFSDDKIIEAEIKRNCFTTSGSSITGYSCTDLQNVVVPEKIGNYSITTIGSQAFYQKNLKSAKIPATVTSIDESAFIYNYFIDFIEVDSNNTVYDSRDNSKVLIKTSTNHLIQGSNLGKVPSGVTSIGAAAFFMMNLEEIEIPEGVTSIGLMAFACNNLKSIKIPSTLTSMDYNGLNAFVYNLDIESIVIDPDNTVYDSRDNSNAIIKTSTNEIIIGSNSTIIPNTVTSIGASAFADLNLTEIVIPDSVTTIGYRAFSGNNLVNVTLGKNVKTIGDRAFRYNEIESLDLPSSVTSIGAYAFQDNNIESVVIPNGVTTISNYVFDGNNLTSVTIPSGVTTIGTYAFGVNNLSSVDIPNSVTSIGTYAFYNNNLTSIVLPSKITVINDYTFYGNNLTNVTIPSGVTSIGNSAFSYNKLENVTMSNNVTTIGNGAFRNNNLTSIVLPSKITAINDYAFCDNKLTSVEMPNTVTSIGNYAFSYNKLENVTMSNNVTSIGSGSFRNNNLTSIVLPSKITVINDYTFSSNKLTSVTIPSGVTSIGYDAFYNNKLTSVDIPNTVTSIGTYAFQTNSLTEVIIPSSVTTIGNSAFSSNKLTSVKIKGKSSSSEFTSYGTNIWGWASGYSDSNIVWNYTE